MRICSGKFDAQMEVRHVQGNKVLRLSQPQQIMADERKVLSEAYAGDIIGVFDPGIFSIGDTLCMPKDKFQYEGIPTFAPEHFARVRQMDTMKRKPFMKGITQIAQEGAIQVFQEFNTGMEEIIVGVVGVLQFEVLKYRLENEYNVEIRMDNLPYEYIRWIDNKDEDFYKEIASLLRGQLIHLRSLVEKMSILKPYSFVLEDDDREHIAELYLVDDDIAIIGGELMEGLDKDLDDFFDELMK